MTSLRPALFTAAAVSLAAAGPVPADTGLSVSMDCERALALSAIPQHLRDRASVLVLDAGRYRTARSGDGPLTCLVERNHPSSVIPVCYDREGTRTILPARVAASEAAMRGATPNELAAGFEEAAAQGRYQAPERPGLAWMVSAHNRILTDGAVQPVGPHLMFYAPGLGDADIGGSPAAAGRAAPSTQEDSQMNQDIVRRFYEDQRALLERLAPEVTWHETAGLPNGGCYRGPEAVMANVFAPLAVDWEDFGATLEDIFESGDRVVTLGHYTGTAKVSGKPLRAAFAHIYRLEHGRVVEFRQFADSVRFLAPLQED